MAAERFKVSGAMVQVAQRMIEKYDGEDQEPRCAEIFDRYRTKVLGLMKRYGSGLALDLGGYDGRVSDEHDNCIVADIAIAPLRSAHQKKRRACVRCDMHTLPFAASSFDLVLLSHALQHSPEPGRVIEEAKRVLKKGGRLALAVPNAVSLGQITRLARRGEVKPAGNPPSEVALQIHQYTPSNLRGFLSAAGFKIEMISGDVVSFPLVHRLRLYGLASLLGTRLSAWADSLIVVCVPRDGGHPGDRQ